MYFNEFYDFRGDVGAGLKEGYLIRVKERKDSVRMTLKCILNS